MAGVVHLNVYLGYILNEDNHQAFEGPEERLRYLQPQRWTINLVNTYCTTDYGSNIPGTLKKRLCSRKCNRFRDSIEYFH